VEPRPWRRLLANPYVLGFCGAAAVLAAFVGAVYLVVAREQELAPPICHGIGFGCSLDPASSALFFAIFLCWVPVAVVVVVAIFELVRVTPWRHRRRLVQQVVALATVAACAALAAAEIGGAVAALPTG
jgi:hypothetical protein